MKVLIRADASATLGVGHVARCLTLAHALRAQGAQVSFACCLLEGHHRAAIEAQGFAVHGWAPPPSLAGVEPWSQDLAGMGQALPTESRFDWLIVDHYRLDARWEHAARAHAQRIAVIDDLADRGHAADLLLDQNFHASASAYAVHLAAPCRLLLGPRYALVRPAGGTTWERAAMGLPSLCVSVADNQRAGALAMAQAGMHLYLGEAAQVGVSALREAIALLLDNQALRESFAQRSQALVDGRGAERVAVALCGEQLTLRMATSDDAQLLFDGRNAPEVRRRSHQHQALRWGEHQAWLGAVLADHQRLLLIAEAADGPVGCLRYDRLPGQRARVSLYLFAGRFGLGWGSVLLARGEAWIRERWPDLLAIEAQVLPDNLASLHVFTGAGYLQSPCAFERVFQE